MNSLIFNAFIVGSLIAVISGAIGYFTVVRWQAFSADALSHIGFTGATGAGLFGWSSVVGAFIFSLLGGLAIGVAGGKAKDRDLDTGLILSFFLGLGVLFIHLYVSSSTEAANILFGSILGVTQSDIRLSLATAIITLITIFLIFRPLLFASVDPEVAQARGLPVSLLSIIFTVLLGVTVAEAIQIVGVLMVFALLIMPAAIAVHLAKKPSTAITLAIILALLITWAGLALTLVSQYPASFYLATLSSLLYFLVVGISHRLKPHPIRELEHPH